MKQISYIVLAVLLIAGFGVNTGLADTAAQDQLLDTYLQHLKSGDTQGLLSLLENPLLNRKKDQLQSNPSYAAFLAKHYDNAKMRVLSVENLNARTSKAFIEIAFPGDTSAHEVKLLLKLIEGQWKIVDELN